MFYYCPKLEWKIRTFNIFSNIPCESSNFQIFLVCSIICNMKMKIMSYFFDCFNFGFDLATIDRISRLIQCVPVALLMSDSACTAGRCAVNYCCSPNPVSKVCFGAGCLLGAASSGTAVATTYMGIPTLALVGCAGGRVCNRLGRYCLTMGTLHLVLIFFFQEIFYYLDYFKPDFIFYQNYRLSLKLLIILLFMIKINFILN